MPASRKSATSGTRSLRASAPNAMPDARMIANTSRTCLASSMFRHYHGPMPRHLLAAVATLLSLVVFSAAGETSEWKSLNAQSIASYRKGDLEAAIATGIRAVDAASAALGTDDPNVATL